MAQPTKISDFNTAIDKLMTALPNETLDIMERVILTAKKDVNARIVNTGLAANGSPLAPYTPAYLQFKKDVGRYRDHVDLQLGNWSINKRIAAVQKRALARNKKSKQYGESGGENKKLTGLKKKIRAKQIADEAAIKKTRRAKAIPNAARLWESIQLTSKKNSGGELRVVVQPNDDFNKKKAAGLSKKRGDFLAINSAEQTKLQNLFSTMYEKMVKSYLPSIK